MHFIILGLLFDFLLGMFFIIWTHYKLIYEKGCVCACTYGRKLCGAHICQPVLECTLYPSTSGSIPNSFLSIQDLKTPKMSESVDNQEMGNRPRKCLEIMKET